jgi:hypothetical protein
LLGAVQSVRGALKAFLSSQPLLLFGGTFLIVQILKAVRRRAPKDPPSPPLPCPLSQGREEVEGSPLPTFPAQGLPRQEILTRLREVLGVGGGPCVRVCGEGSELRRLLRSTFDLSGGSNPLLPIPHQATARIEGEVVSMLGDLFHGEPGTKGAVSPQVPPVHGVPA